MKTTKRRALYVVAALLGALFVLSCLVGFAACGGGSTESGGGSGSGDAHQHEYTRTEVAATCTTAGKITYTCSCGDTFSETLPALGHDYTTGGEHVDATCATAGYTILTCQREGCNATREISGEEATGIHNYVATVKTAATCESSGTMTYTCSACGNSFDETIDALGHDLAVDSDGFYRCKREGCDAVFTEGEVVHHHDYELISEEGDEGYTAPTCTEDGVGTYKCKDCGDTQYNVTIPATGHSFSEADSNGWYTCSNCNKTFNAGVDGASHEHSYSEEAYFCYEADEDGATIKREWIAVCTADDCCAAKVLEGDELRAHTLLVCCEEALGEIEDPAHGDVYGEFTAYGYYREVTDGNYKLMRDIDSELKIVRGERVTIDLNGHTLEDSIEDGQHNGNYQSAMDTIRVMPGAQLTINDSSDLGTGVVDSKEHAASAIRNKEGIVTINGGTIERSLEDAKNGSNSYYTITNFGVMTINDGVKVLSIVTTESTTCECEGDCEENCNCECGCDGTCSCEEGGCGCCTTEESYKLSDYSSLIEVGYGGDSDLNDNHINRDTDAELIVNGGQLVGGKRVKCEVLGTIEFNGGTVHGSAGAVKSYGWLTINDGSFISDDDESTPGKNYVINIDNDADSQGVREIREAESQSLNHHNYIRGGTFSFNLPDDEEGTQGTSLNIDTLDEQQTSSVDYYALSVTWTDSSKGVTENADHVSISGGTFNGGVYAQDWAHLWITGGTINGNLVEKGIRKVGLNSNTSDGNEYIYNGIFNSAHVTGDVDITIAEDSSTDQDSSEGHTALSAEENVYFRISGGYIDGKINVTDSRSDDVTYYKFITGGYFLNPDGAVPYIQDGHAVNRSRTYTNSDAGITGYYHVISSTTTDVTGRVSAPSDEFTFNNETFDGLSGAENYTRESTGDVYDGIVVTSEIGEEGTVEVVVSGVVANVMSDEQKVAFDASYEGDSKMHFYVAVQIVVHPGETISWTTSSGKTGSYTNEGTEDYYDIWIVEVNLGDYSGPTADYGVANFTSDVYYSFTITTADNTTGTSYKVSFKDILIPKTAYTSGTAEPEG